MPEIIDLEVARGNMLKKVGGKNCEKLKVHSEKILQNASKFDVEDSISGKDLENISLNGKTTIFEFSDDVRLGIHLMLHGDFCWESSDKKKNVVLEMIFDTGDTILVKDWSRWTRVELDDPEKTIDSEMINKELGVDPLSNDFTKEKLAEILKRRSRSGIKAILLDQEEIAGIGNAYADESLWEAKIHPKEKCKNIVEEGKVDNLHEAINKVLSNSLEIVRKLSNGDISEQERDFMKVYRKNGTACPRCGSLITQTKVNNRDTFYCVSCQKAP